MYLIYVDESGNTGAKLDDPQQPVHFLAAVFVSEAVWIDGYEYWRNQVLRLTRELAVDAGMSCPPELHAADVYHGTRRFRGMSRHAREQIIRAALSTLEHYRLDVVYSACHKRELALQDRRTQADAQWQVERFLRGGWIGPSSEALRPEVAGAIAWNFLLMECSIRLAEVSTGELAHGLVIADRSKLEGFARRSLRASELISLGQGSGVPSEEEVVEAQVFVNLLDTVHFVDSHESPYIQLADFVAYFIMRAWRAGKWETPGPEPHYDEFVRPAIRGAYHYPPRKK